MSETLPPTRLNVNVTTILKPVTVRPSGPYVVVSEGAPSTLLKLENDAAPKLGGDLDLNAHQITGTLSSPLLIIDGGLD